MLTSATLDVGFRNRNEMSAISVTVSVQCKSYARENIVVKNMTVKILDIVATCANEVVVVSSISV